MLVSTAYFIPHLESIRVHYASAYLMSFARGLAEFCNSSNPISVRFWWAAKCKAVKLFLRQCIKKLAVNTTGVLWYK